MGHVIMPHPILCISSFIDASILFKVQMVNKFDSWSDSTSRVRVCIMRKL